MKIAISNEYGCGFLLTEEAVKRIKSCGNYIDTNNIYTFSEHIDRADNNLIRVIKELGNAATVNLVKIVEIPDEATDYIVTEFDGIEDIYYCIDGKIKVTH